MEPCGQKAGGNHHVVLASALGVGVLWLPVALWTGAGELTRWSPLAWAVVLGSALSHLAYVNALVTGYPVARGHCRLCWGPCCCWVKR